MPHDNRLNPGSGDFAVELRMRTTHSFGNVIQKGRPGRGGDIDYVRIETS